MISYAILVSDEYEEFNRLIGQLVKLKNEDDEIVVVLDSSNTNEQVKNILLTNRTFITYYERNLDGDFSGQKNFLYEKCNGDYIINLDADEIITSEFIDNVKAIIDANPDIEAYWVPRWNEVRGITDNHVKAWGWKLDSLNRINWPDLQMRIIKNIPSIRWSGIVHEQMVGYKNYAIFPLEKEYSIYHGKTIEKQIKQNEFYSKLVK
jgi:glycosyltransferase involved in cell wall biosynthesis